MAGNGFGGDGTFVRSLVGQHRFAGNIADSENCRFGGATLDIRLHKTFVVQCYSGIFQAEILAIGPAAHGHQNLFKGSFRNFALNRLKTDFDPIFAFLDSGHSGAEQNLLEALTQTGLQRVDQVAVGRRNQTRGHFHH